MILCGCASKSGTSNNSSANTSVPGSTNAAQQGANNGEWWKVIDTSNGIYLVICETGRDEYKYTLLPVNDSTVAEEKDRLGARWLSEKEIKDILPQLQLPDENIIIRPYTDPASSYLGTEDKGNLFDKMEALFENKYKVGQQYRDAWDRLKNSGQ